MFRTVLRYTPNPDWYGFSSSISYGIQDSFGAQATAKVYITVNSVNDAPVAVDDYVVLDEDTSVIIDFMGNDYDVDDTFTLQYVAWGTLEIHGTLELVSNYEVEPGVFRDVLRYTPDPDWYGSSSSIYGIQDSFGAQSSANVYITVNPVNDPPVAVDDYVVLDEDTTVIIDFMANDYDVDDTFDWWMVGWNNIELHGEAELIFDYEVEPGVFRTVISYTPDLNWYGSTSAIYYGLADASGAQSATAYVHITVNPVNDAPVGVDDSYTIDEDTSLILPAPGVLSNDYDVDGDAISLDFLTFPQHGGYVIGSNGLFNYHPNPDWYGTDSFTYRVFDGAAYSGVVTVTITVEPVNDAPVALDDNVVTDEDTPIIIDFMANDYDIDDTFDWTYVQWTPTEINGELELVHNYEAEPGVFRTALRYTPDPDWHGSSSSISYGIQDSFGAQASAQIFITVNPVNDAPVAVDDYVVTAEDTPVIIDFMANDYDVDDTFDWSLITYNIYDIHGEIDLLSDYEVEPGVFRDVLRYTPDPDWYGTTSTLQYRLTDASGADSAFAYIHITVTPVNDAPVAVDDAYTTDEDVPHIVAAPGVITNDYDIDYDSLTAVLVDAPLHGSIALNADGSLSYVPDADWQGVDSLTYQVFDGTEYSNIATVTITVNPVNDAPVAVDDVYTTDEDTILLRGLVTGVLANDFDIDGDALAAGLVSAPSHGTLTLNPDGSFSYIPDVNWFGMDSFVYEVSDGILSDTATVTIT
ncbi:MAG: Ig-like domain-containing protein, partial [Candidatus Thorarchaeota archaeon]